MASPEPGEGAAESALLEDRRPGQDREDGAADLTGLAVWTRDAGAIEHHVVRRGRRDRLGAARQEDTIAGREPGGARGAHDVEIDDSRAELAKDVGARQLRG